MATPDQLYTLKNLFWVGNYQGALQEAAKLHLGDAALNTQKDVIVYRSYIALKQYSMVLSEVPSGSGAPALQAVRMLAEHASSTGTARASALSSLEQLAKASDSAPGPVQFLAGTALAAENRPEDALRIISPLVAQGSLEALALQVAVLLQMRRGDLAKAVLQRMQEIDDDATLTQLSSAWVGLSSGRGNAEEGEDPLGEASLVFKDLADRFGATAMLLNGQAVALMALGQHSDAQKALADAAGKNSDAEATLINSIALARLDGKGPADDYAGKLAAAEPSSAYVREQQEAAAMLQKVVDQYSEAGSASA